MKELNSVESMAGTGKPYLEIIPGIQFRVKGTVVHFQINRYNVRDQYVVVDVPVNALIDALDYIKKEEIKEMLTQEL